jgi:hypothetical protein
MEHILKDFYTLPKYDYPFYWSFNTKGIMESDEIYRKAHKRGGV